jgi:hypothetical protein
VGYLLSIRPLQGDVLFGKLRPYLEKFYCAAFDGKCTGEILAFQPVRINGRFLFYSIASRWFIGRCNAFAYSAKMPRVSWPTQLSKFNLPLPPPAEQQHIAAFLDASCAAIDAAVAAKRRQLETLDVLTGSLIHNAVTRGLNPGVRLKPSGLDWLPDVPGHGDTGIGAAALAGYDSDADQFCGMRRVSRRSSVKGLNRASKSNRSRQYWTMASMCGLSISCALK